MKKLIILILLLSFSTYANKAEDESNYIATCMKKKLAIMLARKDCDEEESKDETYKICLTKNQENKAISSGMKCRIAWELIRKEAKEQSRKTRRSN